MKVLNDRIEILEDSIRLLQPEVLQNKIDSIQSLIIPLQIQAQELEDALPQQVDPLALEVPVSSIDTVAFQERLIDLKLDVPLNPSYTEKDWSKHFLITHNSNLNPTFLPPCKKRVELE